MYYLPLTSPDTPLLLYPRLYLYCFSFSSVRFMSFTLRSFQIFLPAFLVLTLTRLLSRRWTKVKTSFWTLPLCLRVHLVSPGVHFLSHYMDETFPGVSDTLRLKNQDSYDQHWARWVHLWAAKQADQSWCVRSGAASSAGDLWANATVGGDYTFT